MTTTIPKSTGFALVRQAANYPDTSEAGLIELITVIVERSGITDQQEAQAYADKLESIAVEQWQKQYKDLGII